MAPSRTFRTLGRVAVTAIDAGVVKLGWTADGIVGAVRAAAVTRTPSGETRVRLYRPGIFALGNGNRLDVLHQMGRALGREDFYVHVVDGRPKREKIQLAVHDHRLLDRVRNFVERLVQRSICDELKGGVVLLDGALTLRTYDTPGSFLRELHESASVRDLSLAAVSKQTGLTVRGVDIRLLLDGDGRRPNRRKLTRAIQSRRGSARVLGDLYVARFSPGGDVYRVDIAAASGRTSDEALDTLAASSRFRNGYPEPLIEAHIFSYFTPPTVAQLQAHAAATYGLVPIREPNLRPIFAPFGGRYK